MTNVAYPFGRILTKDNYQALRSLAQKLIYKEFHKATSFGHGIHNRLRRFPEIEKYWGYIKVMREKSRPRSTKKRITVTDVYSKLESIEKEIKRNKMAISETVE